MATSLEGVPRIPLHVSSTNSMCRSESPNSTPAPDGKDQRRKQTREKDSDMQSMSGSIPGDLSKKEQKKRQHRSNWMSIGSFSAKEVQDTSSSNGSGSRSLQPSPTTVTPHPPSHVVDEDYNKGVADALVVLSQSHIVPMHSPTLSRNPSSRVATLKCPLSPDVDDLDNKRMWVDSVKHGLPSPTGQHTPIPSSCPSPIPFQTQPTSHSPKSHQHADAGHAYLPSPPTILMLLPPHPRPIGSGHGSHPSSCQLKVKSHGYLGMAKPWLMSDMANKAVQLARLSASAIASI
ncbi:hypothetical protein EV363DRAFT_1529875 [Boletus edulis]|nr:hypothetical protein EV363DRAFT_1529875 [Boletus edulis]